MPDAVATNVTVVVTRPPAQAAPLAQRVAALGRNVVVFPLLEIHPLPDASDLQAALNDLDKFAMVAFVSPNAIDAAFAFDPAWPDGIIFAVMGEGSRAGLARHGVTDATATIVSPLDADRTDSQTLLKVLDLAALRSKRVLIIRGETGRELLGDALREAGIAVTQVAAYRRAAPVLDERTGAQLDDLVHSNNDWIVTSSESLHILIQMTQTVAGPVGVAKMQQQNIIVPHVRIAETARELGFENITLTGSGDERLLAALQSHA